MSSVGSFRVDGHELVYEVHGDGPRTFLFTHGILLDAAMSRSIATRLARAGNRVVLPELLGHGRSDRPTHAYDYRLEFHAEHTLALIDHLGVDEVVLGGTSLGANVALQVAVTAPERLRGLVVEMPVLERGTVAGAIQFSPLLVGLRYGWPLLRPAARLMSRVPRTGMHVLDSFLNLVSSDPRALAAVLHGTFVGPGCPPARLREQIDLPTLVIGHSWDLLHPLDDASALARELPNAQLVKAWSVFEARTFPSRITSAIAAFLDEVWGPKVAADRQVGA